MTSLFITIFNTELGDICQIQVLNKYIKNQTKLKTKTEGFAKIKNFKGYLMDII